MNNSCCILVPVYKHDYADYEILCWKQLIRIYGNHPKYPIFYMFPKCLGDIENYIKKYDIPDHHYLYYETEDYVFKSWDNYSLYFGLNPNTYNLCIDNGFDYCLICQSDAFVVSDQLEYWINKGYDYYGGIDTLLSGDYITKVINGGFSLRNCKNVLSILDNVYWYDNFEKLPEDLCLTRLCKKVIPGYEAIYFQISHYFRFIQYAILENILPFAYHGLKNVEMYEYCKQLYENNS